MPPYTEQQRNYWMSAFACGPPVGPHTFTVEAGGAGKFWSQHGTESIGSVTDGSVSLPGDIDVSRLWRRSATQFRTKPERHAARSQTSSRPTPERRSA